MNRTGTGGDYGKSRFGNWAMSATPCLAKPLSLRSFSLRAGLLGLGLALAAAGPAAAAGKPSNCVLGSKAQPTEVIAACTYIIDNDAASREARAAALVARADARANTSGGMSQALADLDRAIALDSKNGTAFRLRGDMTREAGGNLARAEADLSTAIALDPRDAEAYEQRGIVYTNQRKLDRAIADCDQAIALKADYAQAWSDRGVTYYLRGDYEKAVRDCDQALTLDPNRPRTLINRAAAYKKLGRLDKSLADENEAIRLDPKDAEYFDNRGLTYADMKDYDKAIANYDQALQMEQRANFFTNRGDSYQFKGELGAALSDYDAALKLDPNFALAYNNRAVLYKKMGDDRAKALADYEAALRLDPGNENAINGRRIMISEIKRFGAEAPRPLNATDPHPSFDCEMARLAVEKAICADPKLGSLDRQIAETYARLINAQGGRSVDALRRAQRSFVAERNAGFGRPGYDLRMALQRRLDTLQDAVR
jgi:tetratricopeptide (TPR) repeat protein